MIIKGRSRGGSSQLAAYLMDEKNESVMVLEVTGTTNEELGRSLREMEAVGLNATTSQQVLYHAQIAPARADELTQAQYVEAVDRLERALGLEGQPRALVLHSYRGHEHLHVVWSRADVEHGKVFSDSWDRRHHHQLSRILEQEWDLERVRSGYGVGAHGRDQATRDREARQNTRLREEAKAEGTPFREKDLASKEIAWCWENSSDGKALAANLAQMGYALVEGRSGPIAVDEKTRAEYSIARCAAVKREEVRAKCDDVARQIPKTEARSAERKAGRQTHLSPRKAARMVRDRIVGQVANDAGNYEANKRLGDERRHAEEQGLDR